MFRSTSVTADIYWLRSYLATPKYCGSDPVTVMEFTELLDLFRNANQIHQTIHGQGVFKGELQDHHKQEFGDEDEEEEPSDEE